MIAQTRKLLKEIPSPPGRGLGRGVRPPAVVRPPGRQQPHTGKGSRAGHQHSTKQSNPLPGGEGKGFSYRLAVLFALLLLISACGAPEPEPTVDPDAPTVIATFGPVAATSTPTAQVVPQERPVVVPPTATRDGSELTALPAAATAPAPPLVIGGPGGGVRPGDVVFADNATPLALPSPEWRPPPYQVPLALQPDDHFWLERPIPSRNRNYDLEWYPYGNDVLIPELAPYRVHHGLDFPNPPGTPVLAAGSGTVIFAGERTSPRDGISYYGNTIIIEHDWRWQEQPVYTLYAHVLEMFVVEGDRVEAGQLIAGVGQSGSVSGPHLHLEVRVGDNNYYAVRNPALWLAPYEGYGVLAGRFLDDRGVPIRSGRVVVRPLEVSSPVPIFDRTVLTYYGEGIQSDEAFRENFVVGDLPAGRYRVEASAGGRTYARTLTIQPGRTNLVIIQADITIVPTPTPQIQASPTVSGTVTVPAGTATGTASPTP